MDDLATEVRAFVARTLKVPRERVTLDARFVEDFGTDSLTMIELMVSFEEHFDVIVSEEEAMKVRTVGDVVAALERARANAA